MLKERWQVIENGVISAAKKVPPKVALSALAGAGILFPTAVYVDSASDQNPQERSEEVSNFINNRQSEIAEGVILSAGLAFTINAHATGKKYDEKQLHALRISGPALLTAAAGAALIDSQTAINYAIPAGFALTGTYAMAATTVINTFESTRNNLLRKTSVLSGAGLVAIGGTVFLAAANKL